MTIHHDKLAYGKIASLTEEFTEEKLMEMVNSLSGEEECETDKAAVSGDKDKSGGKIKAGTKNKD